MIMQISQQNASEGLLMCYWKYLRFEQTKAVIDHAFCFKNPFNTMTTAVSFQNTFKDFQRKFSCLLQTLSLPVSRTRLVAFKEAECIMAGFLRERVSANDTHKQMKGKREKGKPKSSKAHTMLCCPPMSPLCCGHQLHIAYRLPHPH